MLVDRFHQLDALLATNARYWQFRPFHLQQTPWLEPGLAQALDALTDLELWQLDASPERLTAFLRPWIAPAPALLALSRVPSGASAIRSINARLGVGVPGRKWAQINAFVACLKEIDSQALEWCAGKGHLGRVLAATFGRPVVSVEWQHGLCEQGRVLADHFELNQQFVCIDAMAAPARNCLHTGQTAVALHACGDLHTQLMRHWVASDCPALVLAPCCYHLIQSDIYRPMSQVGLHAHTVLTKADLSLPLQATVTTGARGRRLRDQEILWRLAFDSFQRQARGVDEYLPLPTIQKSLLKGDFGSFLPWACQVKHIPAPALVHVEHWLEVARERQHSVRRMELVAKLFRRPLELWLVLDRALYLQEQGAEVDVTTFCDYQLTPRNFLIRAQRAHTGRC